MGRQWIGAQFRCILRCTKRRFCGTMSLQHSVLLINSSLQLVSRRHGAQLARLDGRLPIGFHRAELPIYSSQWNIHSVVGNEGPDCERHLEREPSVSVCHFTVSFCQRLFICDIYAFRHGSQLAEEGQ